MARLRATTPGEALFWLTKEERACVQACGKSSGTSCHASHVESSFLGRRSFHSSVSEWRLSLGPSDPTRRESHPEKACYNCKTTSNSVLLSRLFLAPSGHRALAPIVFQSETFTLHFPLTNPNLTPRLSSRGASLLDLV